MGQCNLKNFKQWASELYHSPNILVTVGEEPAKDVDGQNTKPTLRLDLHNRQNRLVQNGVPHVLPRLSIGGHLHTWQKMEDFKNSW